MCIIYRLNDTYVQRSLLIKQENSPEELEVEQFQILAWPEGDNPPSLPGLLEVLEDPEVRQPLLVHSRTGVGRTGVIICIHHALKCINAGIKLDLPGLVQHMRQQRGGMIENFEQYKTCITALLRYLQHATGYTTMSIEDGGNASASLPQLDIILPRTHTVAAHPLVANVAKQKVARTYSDPTLNGSPLTKHRLFLQDMIPPPPTQPPPTQPPPIQPPATQSPPTQPPPYTDDDAARAPTSPQIPISPPPPLTPPDNDDKPTSTAQTSSESPMQFKTDSSTISTTATTTTTTTTTSTTNDNSRKRRPSIVVDDGATIQVLFEPDSAILQRKTIRASQHDETVVVTQPHDQLQQETIEEPEIPPQETEENDLFTKTFGSTTSLTSATTMTTTTSATTTNANTSATKLVNTTVNKIQPIDVANRTPNVGETKSQQQQEHRKETQETASHFSTKSIHSHDDTQEEDLIKEVVKPPVTQTTTKLFDHPRSMKKSTSVMETAKTFGGVKSQSKSFSHIPKVTSLISERAKMFGGTATATTSQSKSFGQTQVEQKSSVSEIAKRFGNVRPPTPGLSKKPSTTNMPPKQPQPAMEDQTLTFTFDDVDGEFTEMKLSRSVEKLDQPEDYDQSTQVRTSSVKTHTPPSDVTASSASTNQATSDTPKVRPINKPPNQPGSNQPTQRGIKKLDMSKFAVFGKSINN